MLIRSNLKLFAILLFVILSLTGETSAQGVPVNEKFATHALQTIHAAEATFSATAGAGNFGNLQQLRDAGFIDAALAAGEKYGYRFSLTTAPFIPGQSLAKFQVSAVPLRYSKTGKRSYYIDQSGSIRGEDHNGEPATIKDPLITICYGESTVVASMRALHSAESTYFSTAGANFHYGSMFELNNMSLIDQTLADGEKCGYFFQVTNIAAVPATGTPATFKVLARPWQYPVTGIRSFYIDQSGVLRGADHAGSFGSVNDPPIQN
ncbi:MAG TPA: hypothetical protein VGO50_10275 [Pyrinomonadaceae bacterium]|jgi:hypothetical protein|nr:hypothetical protein [Pyrinomonadaceae bacterium]